MQGTLVTVVETVCWVWDCYNGTRSPNLCSFKSKRVNLCTMLHIHTPCQ